MSCRHWQHCYNVVVNIVKQQVVPCVSENRHTSIAIWHLLSAPGNSWLWCGINGEARDCLHQAIGIAKGLIGKVVRIHSWRTSWIQAKSLFQGKVAPLCQIDQPQAEALSRTKSIAVPLWWQLRWQCHFGGHAWQCALRSSLLTILIWYQCILTWCTKMYLFRSCLHLLSHCSLASNTCWQC